MRITRYITAFLAMFLAAGLTIGLTTTVAHAAKGTRPITTSAGEIRNSGKFQVHGQVKFYKTRKVYLQQRKTKHGKFRTIKSTRTGTSGRFRMGFDGPIGSCYRIMVPADVHFKTRLKPIGCIIRA